MQRPCPCSSKISIFSSFWASIAYFFITIYISYFIFFSCLHVINTAEGEFACLLSDSFYHKPEKSDGRVAGTDEDIVLFTTKAKLKVSQSSITVICFLVIVPFVFFLFFFCLWGHSLYWVVMLFLHKHAGSCMKKQWFWHVCKLFLLYSKDVQELCCISCSPKRGVQLVYK